MCNKDGNLHAGAVLTIFDNLSLTALRTISKPGFWDGLGVSSSLSVWYHRSLPRGMVVRLQGRVVAVMESVNGRYVLVACTRRFCRRVVLQRFD